MEPPGGVPLAPDILTICNAGQAPPAAVSPPPANALPPSPALGALAVGAAVDVALAVVAGVLPVRVAAAGLRQPAADHVADCQDRDVEPDLVGAEDVRAALLGLDRVTGDQDQDERQQVGVELGRLESVLRLRRETAREAHDAATGARAGARSWAACSHC